MKVVMPVGTTANPLKLGGPPPLRPGEWRTTGPWYEVR